MEKGRAQEAANKIRNLSICLFEVALQIANILASLDSIQENIRDSAHILTDIIKELPPEVQEKLTAMKVGAIGANKDSEGVVDLIRRLLKGGN